MIAFVRAWRRQRRVYDETRVLHALRMLRPSQASGYPIHRLAQVGVGRVHAALARLEVAGTVVSEWEAQPAWSAEFRPRRRLYRVVRAERVEARR